MNQKRLCRAITRLADIMKTLRSAQGCPWDAAQSPESLRRFILEEAYEVLEAIDEGVPDSIREELGDLLLQVVFQARIFEERGNFDLSEVAETIADKLVRRHPHVFGEKKGESSAGLDLDAQWERIKAEENSKGGMSVHPLERLPRDLPALMRAAKLVDRTPVAPKDDNRQLPEIENALSAMKKALMGERGRQETILGELLFGLAVLSRDLDMDPEDVLRRTVDRRIGDYPDKPGSAKGHKTPLPPTGKTGAGM